MHLILNKRRKCYFFFVQPQLVAEHVLHRNIPYSNSHIKSYVNNKYLLEYNMQWYDKGVHIMSPKILVIQHSCEKCIFTPQ